VFDVGFSFVSFCLAVCDGRDGARFGMFLNVGVPRFADRRLGRESVAVAGRIEYTQRLGADGDRERDAGNRRVGKPARNVDCDGLGIAERLAFGPAEFGGFGIANGERIRNAGRIRVADAHGHRDDDSQTHADTIPHAECHADGGRMRKSAAFDRCGVLRRDE